MREKLIHELEEERHLRLETEERLREATLESDRSKALMHDLQQQFLRMEETVRNLLQNQGALEQTGMEPVNIMKVYQEKLPEEERKRKLSMADQQTLDAEDSRSQGDSIEAEKEKTRLLLERLKTLEAENSALALENEHQREQYERCLDEVANQVVQALLTQKDLREECLKLKTRVVDLEQQNQSLSVLFQQRVRPASDKLLQKLHSRILDLSSVDLLTEVERNRSTRHLRTDFQSHECQQHVKSCTPTIKCHNQLHMAGPSRHYPRSSCSSSELSLSSACSEYSSGSSCTWNDGRTCGRLSSVTWDKRMNIASSVPSNLSSPAEDLPPTRIKECHILEGLKKLQNRKGFLEPRSLVSKQRGFKDCMDSNEGIYSPGIKCSSHKEQSSCKPKEIGETCPGHRKAFSYDSDSHDDADDESSTLALLHKVPSKDCSRHCTKLSHSISDSLFGWEPNRQHILEKESFFNSNDRPEKLTCAGNDFSSEANSCSGATLPILQLGHSLGNMDLNLQLSDTDDNEALDELHIESSDEKSPSDVPLMQFPGVHMQKTDSLAWMEMSQFASSSEHGSPGSTYSDSHRKACNFITQQKVIKKTSSEECITVIFDAEDGEPIEFCSHQTGVVTVTSNEISVSQQQSHLNAEYTEPLPHVQTSFQNDSDSVNYTVLGMPEDGNENTSPIGSIRSSVAVVATTVSQTVSPGRTLLPSPQKQQLVTPAYSVSCKASQSISFVPAGSHHNKSPTKVPNRTVGIPQKCKTSDKGVTNLASIPISVISEKSPSSPPVKLSRFIKAHHPPCNLESQSGLNHPKPSTNLSPGSKIPSPPEWTKDQNSKGSLLFPQPSVNDCGDPPTRDKHFEVPQQTRLKSPPPPPGRSVSLLIRQPPVPCTTVSVKPVSNIPCEIVKAPPKTSHLKTAESQVIVSCDKQTKKLPEALKSQVVPINTKIAIPSKYTSQQSKSQGACLGPSKVFAKHSSRTCHQPVLSNIQDVSDSGTKTCNLSPSTCTPLEVSSTQTTFSSSKGKFTDCGASQQHKLPCNVPTATYYCPSPVISESFHSQVSYPQLSYSSSCNTEMNFLQNSDGKTPKTRLPLGPKGPAKSPQLLRKSCTVPGKQEKDSINIASKGSITPGKSKQLKSFFMPVSEIESAEPETDSVGLIENITTENKMEVVLPLSLESSNPLDDICDGLENYIVRRSNSSNNKSHLKPALGMNGAKARSQSFSVNVGDKSPTPACEAPSKMRTHIITNTADRGNSLTRQNSIVEGVASRTTPESTSNSSKAQDHQYSRQGSHISMGSSGSQHGSSPSKLPCRTPPKLDLFQSTVKFEAIKSPYRKDTQSMPDCGKLCNTNFKHLQTEPSVMQEKPNSPSSPPSCSSGYKVQTTSKLQSPKTPDAKITHGEAVSAKSLKANGPASATAMQSTIEQKVMLGIQENVQKVQVKSPPAEPKQKTVPSIASWFGFGRSKLPSFSGKKPEITKAKVEKKDTKLGTGFGNKQTKVEKKKEKSKTDLQCNFENKFNKKAGDTEVERSKRISRDISNPMRCEPNTDTLTTTCSAKDIFMKELLYRVDKKAAQQTESGSNNVSSRSVSKGSSQGPSLPGNSISTQGNHKKSCRAKADMEMQKETPTHVIADTICNDQEDSFTDPACQDHIIESSCLMRTLDSGIGTFPLPDSGNRATGRYPSKQESPTETKIFTPPEPDLLSAASLKAQTLEREVPLSDRIPESDERNISHSLSDPTMTTKGVLPFQSRLPKPTSSGIFRSERQSKPLLAPIFSSCSEQSETASGIIVDHRELSSLKLAPAEDRALRVCTYSASSSDTERELEYETNDLGPGGGKLLNLTKNNKQVEQEVSNVRTSFIGSPMSIMDLYQQNVCVQYKEDGPKNLPHYSFLHQLSGTSSTEEMSKEFSSKLKQAGESKEESAETLSEISLESLNKFNRNSLILLEKAKKGLIKVDEQKEENGREEDASLSCSERTGVDNLESLSDSLYDSFSSCASQGSNDV